MTPIILSYGIEDIPAKIKLISVNDKSEELFYLLKYNFSNN